MPFGWSVVVPVIPFLLVIEGLRLLPKWVRSISTTSVHQASRVNVLTADAGKERDMTTVMIRANEIALVQSGRLEESITFQALALRPHGHSDRSTSLDNLACIVTTRLQLCGRLEDLEEAITYHRQALALRPHGIPFVHLLSITSPVPCPLAFSSL